MVIWLTKPKFNIIENYKDKEGRFLLVVNTYAPNNPKSRNIIFKTVYKVVEEKSSGQLILGGDHNDIFIPY